MKPFSFPLWVYFNVRCLCFLFGLSQSSSDCTCAAAISQTSLLHCFDKNKCSIKAVFIISKLNPESQCDWLIPHTVLPTDWRIHSNQVESHWLDAARVALSSSAVLFSTSGDKKKTQMSQWWFSRRSPLTLRNWNTNLNMQHVCFYKITKTFQWAVVTMIFTVYIYTHIYLMCVCVHIFWAFWKSMRPLQFMGSPGWVTPPDPPHTDWELPVVSLPVSSHWKPVLPTCCWQCSGSSTPSPSSCFPSSPGPFPLCQLTLPVHNGRHVY